jgi:hypothetical protein
MAQPDAALEPLGRPLPEGIGDGLAYPRKWFIVTIRPGGGRPDRPRAGDRASRQRWPQPPARWFIADPNQDRKVAITMARSGGNAFYTNFTGYDAPLPTKVRLALANSWKKLRTGSGCCGNYGQPGC